MQKQGFVQNVALVVPCNAMGGQTNKVITALNFCRFGNVREDLIFANIREFVASRIQSSR